MLKLFQASQPKSCTLYGGFKTLNPKPYTLHIHLDSPYKQQKAVRVVALRTLFVGVHSDNAILHLKDVLKKGAHQASQKAQAFLDRMKADYYRTTGYEHALHLSRRVL